MNEGDQSKVIIQPKAAVPPTTVLGTGIGMLALDLARKGSSLVVNGQPVRPEQRIKHRRAKLCNGIGAVSHGAPAQGPDPLKRAMRKQRDLAGMTPRQQRKLFKEQRRLDREADKAAPNPLQYALESIRGERTSKTHQPVQG